MAQVFVPSVGLNLQQGVSQQGARIDTGLSSQINPLDNLKPLNNRLDAISKDLNQWDQMNVQREALERFDNLQQELTANRDLFLTKKGQEAIDYAKTYQQKAKDIYAKSMDNVTDFRVRNTMHANAKRMFDGYVTSGNTYLQEQTAQANVNQVKAALEHASNNYIEQRTNGVKAQQDDAELQFNLAIDNYSMLLGINPNGDDGKLARQEHYDTINQALNKHYIAHKAYNTANQSLDAAQAKMNYKTYLEEKDKIYLAQQSDATVNKASKNGFKLPDKSSWILQTATDIVNSEEVALQNTNPNYLKEHPNWRAERMEIAKLLAHQQYNEMELKVKGLSDNDAALKSAVSVAYNQAQQTGKVYSLSNGGQSGGQITSKVMDNPYDVVGRLDPQLRGIVMGKYGSIEEANKELVKHIAPAGGVSSGNAIQVVMDAQRNPDAFYGQFANETQLRAHLFRNGVGYQDMQNIVTAYNSEQAKREQTDIANVTKYVIDKSDNAELNKDKDVKANPVLAQKKEVFVQYVRQRVRDYKQANPNMSMLDIQSRIAVDAKRDPLIQDKLKAIDDLEDKRETYASFNDELNKYSVELRKAVQAFYGADLESCFTGDYAVGSARLKKMIENALENKNFQNAYSYLPEVKEQTTYETYKEQQKQEENIFRDNILQNMSDLSAKEQMDLIKSWEK